MSGPHDHIGDPSTWGRFGDGERDLQADAERRAMAEYFMRRMAKAHRRGDDDHAVSDIIAGGFVAFAGLLISAAGGPAALDDDWIDRWQAIATFAWVQAISCFDEGGTIQ